MHKKVVLGVIIAVVFGAAVWIFLRPLSITTPPPFSIPPTLTPGVSGVPSQTTLSGEYLCLPHKDTSGPQTMECALGLKTDNGDYYALDFGELLQSGEVNFSTGTKISASGMLVPIEQVSTDHWRKYPIKGIMKIDKVQEV